MLLNEKNVLLINAWRRTWNGVRMEPYTRWYCVRYNIGSIIYKMLGKGIMQIKFNLHLIPTLQIFYNLEVYRPSFFH